MTKRFNIELGVLLHEISKNTFDCDGFDSLDYRHREQKKTHEIENKLKKEIEEHKQNINAMADELDDRCNVN